MWSIKEAAIEKYKMLPERVFFPFNPEQPVVDIDSGIDKERLIAIREQLLTSPTKDRSYAPIFTERSKLMVNLRYRTVHYLKQQKMLDATSEVAEATQLVINEVMKLWGADVEVQDRFHAVGYGEGFHITDHSDNSTTKDGVPKINNSKRMFTALLYLNTINEDYTGGQLEFPSVLQEGDILRPKHELGRLVIFPSNPLFLHRVTKVESGYRVALVAFFKMRETDNGNFDNLSICNSLDCIEGES